MKTKRIIHRDKCFITIEYRGERSFTWHRIDGPAFIESSDRRTIRYFYKINRESFYPWWQRNVKMWYVADNPFR